MIAPPQLEILDLRHFTGRQLRPILEREAAFWRERLRWDYTSSTELLIQYLDSQILPGFVATSGGRICGFCFFVYEGNKAVIGDVFVSLDAASRLEVTQTLTRHLLEVLEASPDVERIESQLLLFDAGVLTQMFAPSGFHVFPRLFLECELEDASSDPTDGPTFPPDIELCRWAPGFYQATAELIHEAYKDHIDSQINDQYRTLHGSLRFLHNVVRFPGCGVFDPEASWILREPSTNAMVGAILCSRVASDVAHVTQLCLDPTYRGKGLGRRLLLHCMDHLQQRGYRAITLTVSEANHSALRLYTAARFTTRLRFDALVLDKTQTPERFRLEFVGRKEVPSETASGLFSFARRKATPARS